MILNCFKNEDACEDSSPAMKEKKKQTEKLRKTY